MSRSVLVVTGLNREAKLAIGPGLTPMAGGGDSATLAARLDATDPSSLSAVVSFGLAGALDPNLAPGDLVLGTSVATTLGRHQATPALVDGWAEHLRRGEQPFRRGAIAGVDAPVMSAKAKAELRDASKAAAVDMESHHAATFAARHGLSFGVLRVVSDGADRTLPAIAGAAMRPDGSVNVLGVLADLARDPRQLPALIATARDAAAAFRTLRRVRGLLSLGGSNGGLFGLDLR